MISEPPTICIYIRLDVAMEDIHWTLAILREVLSTTSVACTHGNFASRENADPYRHIGPRCYFSILHRIHYRETGGKGDDEDDPKYARVNWVLALHTQPFETLK